MEEISKGKNDNFTHEMKQLVIFLASTVFVKFHQTFLVPSKDSISNDQLASVATFCHHFIHLVISTAIQIGLLIWVIRIICKATEKEYKSHEGQNDHQ